MIFTLLDDDTYSVRINPTYTDIKAVVIPSTYNGKSVTQVNESGFVNCTNLERITIPETITVFGSDAFKDCSNLSIVHYEGQLDNWFNVTISGNIYASPFINGARMYVGDGYNLVENIVVPDTVKKIRTGIFAGCTSIKTVTIHNEVTEIISQAFRKCVNLQTVNIPASVKKIGKYAFYESGLTNATFEIADNWKVNGEPMTWKYRSYSWSAYSNTWLLRGESDSKYDLSDSTKAAEALKGPVKVASSRYDTDISYSTKNYCNMDWTHE